MPETTERHVEAVREIRISDYFWILYRHKWSALLIFLCAVFVAFLIADFTTPVYQSETTLRVLDGQPTPSLLSQLPLSGLLGGTSLGAYAAQIQSRDYVITPAIRQLRAEGLLDPLPLHRGRILRWCDNSLGIRFNADATEQGELTLAEWEDFFVKTLIDEQLKVEETPDGSVITVTVTQRDPERAQNIANRIAAVFQAAVETETVDRMQWWEKPNPQLILKQTTDDLTKAEEALFQFQQDYPEITLNAEGATQAQVVLALQVKENELIDLLVSAEFRRGTYQAELEGLSENVVSETVARNPSHSKLQDSLNQYEIDRAELLGKYDETHPEVTAIDEKIREARTRLAKEPENTKSTTTSYNPLHQALTEKLNEAEAAIVSLKKQREETAAKIAAHFERLGSWSPAQLEFYRLKRAVEVYNAQVLAMETKIREAEIFAQARTESIKVLDTARAPEEPLKPRLKLYLALGVVAGGFLGFTYAVARNYFKDTYLRLEDAVRQLDTLPEAPNFLGVIPVLKKGGRHRLSLIAHDAPDSRAAEAFRILQTKLPFLKPGAPVQTILVTSAARGDGKSTIAANLVVSLAQQGNRVLLIDADMRRPMQHTTFLREDPDPRKPGLSEALIRLNGENTAEVFQTTVRDTDIPNVDLIPSGTVPPNPIELLNSEFMTDWMEHAKSEYDVIVIDSPPIRAVADTMILANMADAVVYVFDITKTTRFDTLTGIRDLRHACPDPGIGVVCNRITPQAAKSYGYYEGRSGPIGRAS